MVAVSWHYVWIVVVGVVAAGGQLIARSLSQRRRDQGRAGPMSRPLVTGRKNLLWLIVAAVAVLVVADLALGAHRRQSGALADSLFFAGVVIGVGLVVGLLRRTFPPKRRR